MTGFRKLAACVGGYITVLVVCWMAKPLSDTETHAMMVAIVGLMSAFTAGNYGVHKATSTPPLEGGQP